MEIINCIQYPENRDGFDFGDGCEFINCEVYSASTGRRIQDNQLLTPATDPTLLRPAEFTNGEVKYLLNPR